MNAPACEPLVSVVLNNYNYGCFLAAAIDSVLTQSYRNLELVVVDDGSTDASRAVVEHAAKRDPRVRPIFKDNGGQGSALNAGFQACRGAVVSFLDSDDEYLPGRVSEAVRLHAAGRNFVFVRHREVFEGQTARPMHVPYPWRTHYDGRALFLVYHSTLFTGRPTSTVSMTRTLAERIFPIEDVELWRTEADGWLVYAGGMMDRPCYLDSYLVRYRVHGRNTYYGNYAKQRDRAYWAMRRRSIEQLKACVLRRLDLTRDDLADPWNLSQEFASYSERDFWLLLLYLKALGRMSGRPLARAAVAARMMVQLGEALLVRAPRANRGRR